MWGVRAGGPILLGFLGKEAGSLLQIRQKSSVNFTDTNKH